MKRKELIRKLEEIGCIFIRHGGNHDWYQNPRTKLAQPVPRHNEVNENLAKHIIKMLKKDA
ncbi:MAG: addiction module toxin, HicA family [Nitrospinae bacterium RIFCSPLOWO2_02_39_17]|nr:MAG: addiction module toxin, HicA family [Nitrospinae bacterium RIFCSPHIGHO2_02_39_11]OGW02390.1 MAG: addiction module toxin, HicA family [Nitrospinae bacterium RIFCSPLOWO2_02_39_17]OGW08366.1 MAG: addiction module toxin, HicA family [Nitrospinae bacterium RIFCSPLOWO2_12_39_15]